MSSHHRNLEALGRWHTTISISQSMLIWFYTSRYLKEKIIPGSHLQMYLNTYSHVSTTLLGGHLFQLSFCLFVPIFRNPFSTIFHVWNINNKMLYKWRLLVYKVTNLEWGMHVETCMIWVHPMSYSSVAFLLVLYLSISKLKEMIHWNTH